MSKISKIQVSEGIHWVEVPDVDLRVLCACPFDSVKHLRKGGLILTKEEAGVTFETGPDAILLSDVLLQNGGFAIEIWNKAEPEVPLDNVNECASAMTEYEPDLIVAVGGGSVIDLAKSSWILYERPDITDLTTLSPATPLGLRKKARLLAVPTTSGTGSETTAAAVLTDEVAHRKMRAGLASQSQGRPR